MEAVKKFKKGRGERQSFLGQEDDAFPVSATTERSAQQPGRKKPMEKSKKRVVKVRTYVGYRSSTTRLYSRVLQV